MALAEARHSGANIILVSEPPPRLGGIPGKSVVLTPPPNIPPMKGAGDGLAWIEFDGLLIISCYFSPNISHYTLSDKLQALEVLITSSNNSRILIAGDFNAKSTAWGSSIDDPKGNLILDLVTANNLTINNIGNTPTFCNSRGHLSYIDLTFTRGLSIQDWKVREDLHSYSDHYFIAYTASFNPLASRPPTSIWSRRILSSDKLQDALRKYLHAVTNPQQLKTLLVIISDACM